ncbi:maleylpyruvate isomerase family mycothiol-dependent enzyme [Actinoplanes sichuanensis]|uniref:Maleylpyruvate isomerase family mycothiol-dependent enzyme n=1 Tax=Actinoplanes sichuanensis TaxID=512349 RepID=A0ABW4AKY4_9ACTN|nr:maleylpyruvate isomerase family mycothiol-dependent enzyme [Actinoplanes sichuanensis]BEL11138.1 maleylpyruvate isomerase family mycothiol-dependent enzyme [Actinoplanes sichuanensis]
MNRLHATKDFWLAALRADGPALWDAVAETGPEAAVSGCPDWTVADLAHHVTEVLHWVRNTVTRGVTALPEFAPALPATDWPETLDVLRRELTGTIETLEALDPDFPAWNWAPQPKRAGFWDRRMAHEISVHRWDAESAAGRATPIETKLATDGVSEILDTWLPAGKRQGPTDLHGVVHLVGTDAGQEWFVRLRGSGIALLDTGTILDSDDHHARAKAMGSVSDLQLALMGRKRADQLALSGDPRLFQALRTG